MRPVYKRLNLASVLSLLGILPCLAATSPKGIEFHHGDWMVACDNTRTCRAAGYQPDSGEHAPVSVLLTRKGGPRQPVTAQLAIGDIDQPPPPSSLRLRINGSDLGPVVDRGPGLTSRQVTALLRALTVDSEILVVDGDDSNRVWRLSDQGAAAVLLKTDEFQGRLGTPGALLRKGNRSENSVPVALAVPIVKLVTPPPTRAADRALERSPSLRSALRASTRAELQERCPDLFSDERDYPLTVRRLSGSKLLVSTQCWIGGQNAGFGYWMVNHRESYQADLVTISADESTGASHIFASQRSVFGDCLSAKSWGWDGKDFVPISAFTTGLCRLVTLGGPWQMPMVVTRVQE
ncbi:DUF1176 domain-containing protein [Stenotrophomonas rhizophila]|uniref:DUF1176 domain-containing protein n=1 Tax=Stenotrophomonas rhizophila TaxID=216778 RepID=UPI001E50A397|nr:DUF1176 domain-containing protein [Stenotrophomonas rhizophila]MCC7633413.1 DUF1176 domain-containing protein [Stenotrophomonas rhizophila]MCC7663102.1 DUF1176 domain-containing protein [Stenotrophomonas rhizophila]